MKKKVLTATVLVLGVVVGYFVGNSQPGQSSADPSEDIRLAACASIPFGVWDKLTPSEKATAIQAAPFHRSAEVWRTCLEAGPGFAANLSRR